MSILYVVVPLAVLIVFFAVIAFSWAARQGQFDDLDTPAVRLLHDELDGRRRDARPDPARSERDDRVNPPA